MSSGIQIGNLQPLLGARIVSLYGLCWIAGDHCEGRNTSCNHSVRSDDAVSSNRQMPLGAEHDGYIPQPAIFFDLDCAALVYSLSMNRSPGVGVFMVVVHDQHGGSEEHILFQDYFILHGNRGSASYFASPR